MRPVADTDTEMETDSDSELMQHSQLGKLKPFCVAPTMVSQTLLQASFLSRLVLIK